MAVKHLGQAPSAFLRQTVDQTPTPKPVPHYEVVVLQKVWKLRPGNRNLLEALALLMHALRKNSRSYNSFPQSLRNVMEGSANPWLSGDPERGEKSGDVCKSAQSAQTQPLGYSFEDDDDDVDFVDEENDADRRLQHIFQSLTSLEAERQRLMREAVECTGLNEDEAVLLLRGCAWDVAVFNEAFFEDAEALRSRIGVAEEDCQMSSAEGAPLCSICFSEPGESLMPCQAPELFCRDCWRQYLEQAVQEGRGCLDLRCPAVACKELVRPSLFASLLSAPLLERYQRFLTGSLVDDSRGKLRWCPGRNCSAAAGEPLGGLQEVTCPCGTSWCFRCGNDVHLPVTCETVRRWEEKNRDEGLVQHTAISP
ncbi:unnamed protein product [Cladocopium goreaui]|uniref:RBR-type E3 ubiquitin transferase n=1 Tax=Cladocopium goreaui TaxID=2562237 RepID=A0A9P1C492_9DINO|nr:unnamed protein product [Cladocopium goreaui]